MKTLPSIAAAAASLLFFNIPPAVAENCGRWVECTGETNLDAADLNSYIYGNRTEVEPWVGVEDEVEKNSATSSAYSKSAAPAPITLRLPSDLSGSKAAVIAERDATSDDDGLVGGLTATERAELDAELAAQLERDSLGSPSGVDATTQNKPEPARKKLGVESVITNGSASSQTGIRVISPGIN